MKQNKLSKTGTMQKTVTDSRGNTVTNEYDAKNRLLTAVVDAKGNKTSYTYEANTDRLLSVAATTPQGEVKNTYTYDQDRLATIGHNGMTYRFAYDGFGNRTSVKIGS